MDAAFKNLLLGLALYVAVAAVLLWFTWLRTARVQSNARRVWLRALVVSCLFSPTVFACGGIAPVPFPVLVGLDLYALATSAGSPCGYQSLPNAVLVCAVGVLFGLVHLGISRWQHAQTKQAT
jgi:hypothetical protein